MKLVLVGVLAVVGMWAVAIYVTCRSSNRWFHGAKKRRGG